MRLNQHVNLQMKALVTLAILLTGAGAHASDFQSPRTAALGGAGHAGPILNDSIYLNPSYNSFLPSYSIGINYLNYKGSATEPDGSSFYHGHALNGSVQDGRSELFQAGVGFTQLENARMIHFGASRRAIERLGFGLGGKFIFPSSGPGAGNRIQDMTFSTTGIVSKGVQVAAIVDNLFETALDKQIGLYREFILGTKFNVESILLIYFDPHWVPNLAGSTYGHETGLEFPMMQDFFLRLGMFRNSFVAFDGTRDRGYGAGFGWLAPRLSMDYALQRVLAPVPATAHVFGMTMYF